ncbi:MAG TPA: hypothetical protein PKY35_12370 [Candidatus Hydrogenedentes bacterium]|nr:hypothetical protein [Candidatus Hydrogenedentota bacterium]HOL77813.1 hypothetical protein [Candidatus Hydrogenedentota bacterium]HPO86875.1 hypothetical protein [Candidatus Hydrogenedentota bacterium]
MATAKKRPLIHKQQDEEMAEIDEALDEALLKLETANSRIQEVLQSVESPKNSLGAGEGQVSEGDSMSSSGQNDVGSVSLPESPTPLSE